MIGIIFWTVEISIKINKLSVLERDKNHLWKGAAPNLIIILVNINISITKLYFIKHNKTQIIYKIEAILWIIKYFIEFSIGEYSLDIIIGRNLSIFNSSLTHIIILESLLIEINNLIIKTNLNSNKGLKIIILIRFFFLLTTSVVYF